MGMECMNFRACRIINFILATLLIISLVPLNVFADAVNPKCYSTEEGKSFEIDSFVTSSWDNHANIELVIKNTGDKKIDNWHLTFNTSYAIENIWNASIVETNNIGTYTIRNNYYNQDIEVNSEVTIGMTLNLDNETYTELSNWYLLNTKSREIKEDEYLITYQEYSKWDKGFNGVLMLSAIDFIEDWSLSFDSEYEINNISNAVLETKDGSYEISNDCNSQNLSSNILIISIQGVPTEKEFEISNLEMRSIGLAYNLTEDIDNNGIPDYMDLVYSKEGVNPVIPSPSAEPTITPVLTITDEPTTDPTSIPTVIVKPTVTEEIEMDDFTDSDDDGLTDYEELFYGTNKNEPDSDFDGIKDSVEVQIGFNPNYPDSNNNGISDGNEDFDEDGLTNYEEEEYGTCVFAPDSDYDDIKDYEELFIYGTDPRKEDSNDDGIFDGDALKLGLNPVALDSDGDGVLDKDEKSYQEIDLQISEDAELKGVKSVEVKGEFTNLITSTTTIEDVYGKDVYSSQIEAIVGGLVSIETSSEFDTATVVFHYDENEIGVDEEDLCILWYDEANGEYVMLDEDQILDKENNTVSYVTTHFSEYMLISKTKWIQAWEESIQTIKTNRIKYQTGNDGSVKFLVAMNYADIDTEEFRSQSYDAFDVVMDSMGEQDIILLTYYNTYSYSYREANKSEYIEIAKNNTYKTDLYAYKEGAGWGQDHTNLLNIVSETKRIFAKPDEKVVLIMITDAYVIDFEEAKAEYEEYFNKQPQCDGIIVISLGNLEYLYPDDFVCYKIDSGICSDKSALQETFPDILSNILSDLDVSQVNNVDTDGDTLSDFEEITGHLLSNGTIVYTDPNTKYSDKDTLSDDEELGIRKSLKLNSMFSRSDIMSLISASADGIEYYDALSSPVEEDIDKDDFFDELDATPWEKNPEIVYLFSTSAWFDNSKMRVQFYKEAGINTKFVYVYNIESFLTSWNNIGIKNDYIYEQLEKREKYDYIVKAVVISAHGGPKSIYLGEGEYLYGVSSSTPRDSITITSNKLSNKKIESLYIYACNCGRGDDNLATDFLKFKQGIKQVIAPDAFLWYFDSKDGVGFLFTSATVYIDNKMHDDLKNRFEEEENEIVKQTKDYNSMFGICGFKLFDQEGNQTDIYTDENEDVFCVNVYTTNEKYKSNDYSGYFLFPQKELSGIYHDPILNKEV